MNMLVKKENWWEHMVDIRWKKRVYSSLFGYRDHESKEKMTLDTTMIIQSTPKSLSGDFSKKHHQIGPLCFPCQVSFA